MNIVAMIGNVASQPALRHTETGRAVCTFRLAVSRPGGDEADVFDILTWERQAEIVNEHVTIGRRVGIEGRAHHASWEDKTGKRSKVEIIAHRLQILGAPTQTPDQENTPT